MAAGFWNHRIIKHVCKRGRDELDSPYEFQEVFYGLRTGERDMHKAEAQGDYHHGAVALCGDDMEELEDTIGRMKRALERAKNDPSMILNCKCEQGGATEWTEWQT